MLLTLPEEMSAAHRPHRDDIFVSDEDGASLVQRAVSYNTHIHTPQ